MDRERIRFGVIGLGLIGKEFASAVSRWCHLKGDGPIPVITAICNRKNQNDRKWFTDHFPTIGLVTEDYRELAASEGIDAVYCAVPHNLHEAMYRRIIQEGKHLLGEKPFGIDALANKAILDACRARPDVIVRCTSHFPYYPGARKVIEWLREKRYGRLMAVRCGFLHSSDMDLDKPINWKRQVEINGEYGCLGDLGLHVLHIPLRMGWAPQWIYADLQNIAKTRPDGNGKRVPCATWDNGVLTCRCREGDGEFPMILEMKRMAPGETNTWFIEVYGTEGSIRFSTRNPKALYVLETKEGGQGWMRTDLGHRSFIPGISGEIFEFGFSDAFQQMVGAFMNEFITKGPRHPFGTLTPEETGLGHRILSAALESNLTEKRVNL